MDDLQHRSVCLDELVAGFDKDGLIQTWYVRDTHKRSYTENDMCGWTNFKDYEREYFDTRPGKYTFTIEVLVFTLDGDKFVRFPRESSHDEDGRRGWCINPNMKTKYKTSS